MSVTVTEHTAYVAHCDECSRTENGYDREVVERWASEHTAEHTASKVVGAKIAGQVFSTDRHPTRLGFIDRAAAEAKRQGFAYFEFNGLVHATMSWDASNPLAWERDVPGLAKEVRA